MSKWLLVLLSVVAIVTWISVIWIFIGIQNTSTVEKHFVAERSMTDKVSVEFPKEINHEQFQEEIISDIDADFTLDLKSGTNGEISIDEILAALGIEP
ncbi:hypothetical protein GH741_09105 [Aquibacillus halophilus]|uniref:Uncharacterized protein n=1 Tax=Aquibacillus halophilus TaxID=930132 RepID=A0A6A8DNL7_9BACI|nr:hypothetical protein [Aquibacillus halophilus]MRH42842.1 hypothetical protein [Aquibacillus halophilus]